MINHRSLRIALRKPYNDALTKPVAVTEIAWEGESFNRKNREIWVQETLLTSDDAPSDDVEKGCIGIYHLNIFAPQAQDITAQSWRAQLEEVAFDYSELYSEGTQIENGDIRIVVDAVNSMPILQDAPYQYTPLQINFRAFQG